MTLKNFLGQPQIHPREESRKRKRFRTRQNRLQNAIDIRLPARCRKKREERQAETAIKWIFVPAVSSSNRAWKRPGVLPRRSEKTLNRNSLEDLSSLRDVSDHRKFVINEFKQDSLNAFRMILTERPKIRCQEMIVVSEIGEKNP